MTESTVKTPSQERVLRNPGPGLPILVLGLITVFPAPLVCWIVAGNLGRQPELQVTLGVLGLVLLLVGILLLRSLTVVNPNQAKVILLFGRYVGTIRREGFFRVNPFTVRKSVSLRAHNFTSEKLKVNDKLGNPIEIGAVVVWRVHNTAMASFDVEDYRSYVQVQSEAAVRHLAANHPYDTSVDESAPSLRASRDEVNEELKRELAERLALAGIEVLEARLSHLAYAPEIAGAMLKRQQAEAVIAARQKLVDGAVVM